MNGNTGGSRSRSQLRRLGAQASAAAGIALLAAVALLATACGGGGSGGGSSGSGGKTAYQKELAFSECMRAHGVPNFPDPGSNGVISIQANPAGGAGKGSPAKDQRIGGAQMMRANRECAHLLPNGGVPSAAQQQQLRNQALKFAECMRSHGVPNYPDPSTSGGAVTIGGSGINVQSPQFQAANRACSKNLRGKGGALQIQG